MPKLIGVNPIFTCLRYLFMGYQTRCYPSFGSTHSAVVSTSDSRARGPGLDTQSGSSLPFPLQGNCQLLAKVSALSTDQQLRQSKPVQE